MAQEELSNNHEGYLDLKTIDLHQKNFITICGVKFWGTWHLPDWGSQMKDVAELIECFSSFNFHTDCTDFKHSVLFKNPSFAPQ